MIVGDTGLDKSYVILKSKLGSVDVWDYEV